MLQLIAKRDGDKDDDQCEGDQDGDQNDDKDGDAGDLKMMSTHSAT